MTRGQVSSSSAGIVVSAFSVAVCADALIGLIASIARSSIAGIAAHFDLFTAPSSLSFHVLYFDVPVIITVPQSRRFIPWILE